MGSAEKQLPAEEVDELFIGAGFVASSRRPAALLPDSTLLQLFAFLRRVHN